MGHKQTNISVLLYSIRRSAMAIVALQLLYTS